LHEEMPKFSKNNLNVITHTVVEFLESVRNS